MFEFAYRGGVHRGSATMRRHVEPPPLQLEQQIAPVLRALAGAIGDNDVHFGSAVTSHQSLDSGCGVAAMRIFILSGMIALALSASAHARAQPSNTALFDFEMIDTSLDGEMYDLRPDEQARLKRVGDQLRKGLAASDKFIIVDIAPVREEALKSNLQACGGCDVKLAQRLGADLSITGTVQKVSNLILYMNVYIRDVHSGKLVISMSADFRGNTDESWARRELSPAQPAACP